MSIKEFLLKIKSIADNHKLINHTSIDDVYDVWQGGEIRYPAFNIAVENIQYSDEDNLNYLNVVLYYGDRLMQDKSNLVDIHTDSTRVLQSITNNIFKINEVGSISDYTIELWNQLFNDYLAGGYVRLRVGLLSEVEGCSMDSMIDDDREIDITENGTYDVTDYNIANVNVEPKLEAAQRNLSLYGLEGSFTIFPEPGYDGFSIVNATYTVDSIDRIANIDANGEYEYTGVDGGPIRKINVNVNVPSVEAVEITQAEYDALTEYDDYKIYLIID